VCQREEGVKSWSIAFVLCWNCIHIGFYYKWTSIMPSISYHGQPFFKSYNFLLVRWISFSHLSDDFMHAHPHYIFCKFFGTGDFIIISFNKQQGNLLGGVLFALTHLHTLCPYIITHLTWFFLSLSDDMHIVVYILDVVSIFLRL
jgi:hypothetical protein